MPANAIALILDAVLGLEASLAMRAGEPKFELGAVEVLVVFELEYPSELDSESCPPSGEPVRHSAAPTPPVPATPTPADVMVAFMLLAELIPFVGSLATAYKSNGDFVEFNRIPEGVGGQFWLRVGEMGLK